MAAPRLSSVRQRLAMLPMCSGDIAVCAWHACVNLSEGERQYVVMESGEAYLVPVSSAVGRVWRGLVAAEQL